MSDSPVSAVQHRDPAGITAALMAVVHDDASVDDALALIGGTDEGDRA